MKHILSASVLFIVFSSSLNAQDWISYYNKAQKSWGGDWNEVQFALKEAIKGAEEQLGKKDIFIANALNDYGVASWHLGEIDVAVEAFEKSLELKSDLLEENDVDYIASISNLAGVYQKLREFEKSATYYSKTLTIYDEHPDLKDDNYVTTLNNYATLQEEIGNFSRAEALYKESLENRKLFGGSNSAEYIGTVNNLAKLYGKVGSLMEAEKLLLKTIPAILKNFGKSNRLYTNAIVNLASIQQKLGEYTKSEENFLKATEVAKNFTNQDYLLYPKYLNNLAGLYRLLENYDRAEDYYLRSLKIYQEHLGTDNPDYARALYNMAYFYNTQNKIDEGIELNKQAMKVFLKLYGDQHPLYATVLSNLASMYRKKGVFSEAEKLYLKTIEIDRNTYGEKHPLYATSLNNLATLYIFEEEVYKAKELYLESLEIKKQSLGVHHPSYAKTLSNLSLIELLLGYNERSLRLQKESIDNQLKQVNSFFPSMSEKERESFYWDIRKNIEWFFSTALLEDNLSKELVIEVFNKRMATKALLFKASNRTRESILTSSNAELINMFDEWKKLQRDLINFYRKNSNKLMPNGVSINDLERKADDLEKRLSSKSASFASQLKPQITYQQIQSRLKKNEAAIEIIRFKEYEVGVKSNTSVDLNLSSLGDVYYGFKEKVYYAFLIVKPNSKTGPELVLMSNGLELETLDYSYYKNAIKYKISDERSYNKYWSKIGDKLKGVEKIYVSADGVYNLINLNTLKKEFSNEYLTDEYNVHVVTSLDEIFQENSDNQIADNVSLLLGDPIFDLEENKRATLAKSTISKLKRIEERSFVLAGGALERVNPLPGTREEVLAIGNKMQERGWKSEMFLGEEALEEVVKNVESPKVLHIATHGFFSGEVIKLNPNNGFSSQSPLLNSGLLLSGAAESIQSGNKESPDTKVEDGVLTAYEAMNLDLVGTELVVLSACETGLGEVREGEGVYGLQRAFKIAGANSVLISLWKVQDDVTKELMINFYTQWERLKNKTKALKKAQQIIRKKYPDPYYWGAFVMVGA